MSKDKGTKNIKKEPAKDKIKKVSSYKSESKSSNSNTTEVKKKS